MFRALSLNQIMYYGKAIHWSGVKNEEHILWIYCDKAMGGNNGGCNKTMFFQVMPLHKK